MVWLGSFLQSNNPVAGGARHSGNKAVDVGKGYRVKNEREGNLQLSIVIEVRQDQFRQKIDTTSVLFESSMRAN